MTTGNTRARTLALRLFGWILVGSVVGYFFYAQLFGESSRSLTGVRLEDANCEEVSFLNSADEVRLAALLFLPEGKGTFPAAVVIHGSGTSQRDNGWYLTLSTYLQRNGVAVLLPDKRGSERSEGDWRRATFEDLARDALAGLDFVARHVRVDEDRVGLIGMSQGGHVAPLAASMSSQVDFVVNVVGAAIPMHDALVYEENHNLRQMGVLPGLSDLLAPLTSWTLIHLRQRDFWSTIGNFDPRPYWRELSQDALVLYGEEDTNVPTKRSAESLESLANPRIDIRIYPGSGHALEDPPGVGRSVFREEALRDIRDFIVRRPSAPR